MSGMQYTQLLLFGARKYKMFYIENTLIILLKM